MSELNELVQEMNAAIARQETVVLATVVRTEGSVYRRMGARMLVRADDTTLNAVSGGCLEADIVARARKVRESGVPTLVTYDTRSSEDIIWGFGLGCQGVVEVLLEPLSGDPLVSMKNWLALSSRLRSSLLFATVIRSSVPTLPLGERLFMAGGSGTQPASPFHAIPNAIEEMQRVRQSGRSCVRQFTTAEGETVEAALEVVAPRIGLLICGAGHDAVPLARLANELGWRVTVVDHRAGYARPDYFPGADVKHLTKVQELEGMGMWSGKTAAVVMSHNYERDRDYLSTLLKTPIAYIGMLGPRRRTDQLLCELEQQGQTISESDRARIFAPIGLDLGSESPSEIALAIVAEISAVMNGTTGRSLRERPGPIHVNVPEPVSRPVADTTSVAPASCPTEDGDNPLHA